MAAPLSDLQRLNALVDSITPTDQTPMKEIDAEIEKLKLNIPDRKADFEKLKGDFHLYDGKSIGEDEKKILKNKIQIVFSDKLLDKMPAHLLGLSASMLSIPSAISLVTTEKSMSDRKVLDAKARECYYLLTEKEIKEHSQSPKAILKLASERLDNNLLAFCYHTNASGENFREFYTILSRFEDIDVPDSGDADEAESAANRHLEANAVREAFDNDNSLLRSQAKGVKSITAIGLARVHPVQIPSQIQFFPNLESLDWHHNKTAKFPQELASLPLLKILELSSNRISELPDLSGLVSLQTLDIHGNLLTSLPDSIWTLPNLKELGISRNRQLHDIVPSNKDEVIAFFEKSQKPFTIQVDMGDLNDSSKEFLEVLGKLKNVEIIK